MGLTVSNLVQAAPFKTACQNVLTVTSSGDNGAGSLRQAIADACVGGVISFDRDTTITLTSGDLDIGKDLSIDGADRQIILDGNSASRIFNITGGVVNLNKLILRHGREASSSGGGIFNAGSLTVSNSVLSDSSSSYFGGGILNQGSLTITDSSLSGNWAAYNGGGIVNSGSLMVVNSAFAGNSARMGGGIYNEGLLNVTDSSFADNSASYGGGIYFESSGWFGSPANLTGTRLAGNSGGNCYADSNIIDGGHNLETGSSCGFEATGTPGSAPVPDEDLQ